jgi:hypothetical protein
LNTFFFRNKDKLQVDLGDLQNQAENLSSFLRSNLKSEVTANRNKLTVNQEGLTPQKLQKAVNKFVYHQNLNSTHWVSIDGNVVKINRFKHTKKTKENKNPVSPSIITHGW